MLCTISRRIVFAGYLLLALGCGDHPGEKFTPPSDPGDDWPQWRGAHRDGQAAADGLLDSWGRGEPREIWRRELGAGFSSLSIAEGRVLTLFAQGPQEFLIALETRTGDEIWRYPIGQTLIDSTGSGPRSTPTIDRGVVYFLGTGRAVAVTAEDGRELWSRTLAEPPLWGFSSSPLLTNRLMIFHAEVVAEEGGGGAVTALDRITGKVVWTAESGHPGYASPRQIELGGKPHLLSFLGAGLVGLDPATGERLWHYPWSTAYSVNAADPLFLPPDRIFVSSGYDNGSSLIRIHPEADRFRVEELWSTRGMKNHFSTSVAVGEYLYGFDNATLRCLALADGQNQWSKRGFGKGSLIVAGDKLLVLGDNGTLALVMATPEAYRELGSVEALDAGSWTPPSIAGSWLFARDHREIVALYLGR